MARPGPKPRVSSDLILAAAERLFARQGYGPTSLRQLIAETGISSTAFYARYPSKEAVLAALVARLLSELLAIGAQILPQVRSLEEMFVQVPRAIVELVRERRTIIRLAITEAPATPSIRPALENAYRAIARLIADYLARQVERRLLHGHGLAVEDMAWSMVGSVYVQIMRWAIFEHLSDEQLYAALQAAVRLPWAARPPSPRVASTEPRREPSRRRRRRPGPAAG